MNRASQGFEWTRIMVVEGVNRQIDDAAESDGLSRAEWLQRAVDRALKLSEKDYRHE